MDETTQFSDKLGGAPHSKHSLRLWLRLLSCSTVVEKSVRGKMEAEFSMTLPRFDVLAALNRSPKGLTMTELSGSLMVSNGNVTGLVARLIKDRMVSRALSARDRRSAIIRLTPQGQQTFSRLARLHERWIDRMFEQLNTRQIDQLMKLLARLRRSVEESRE
jgi:DNA-binding MarR family transcriptional regulator